MKRRLVLSILAAACALPLFAGCGGSDKSKTDGGDKAVAVLRVACDPTYPPMEFPADDGSPMGFDPDIIIEAAKRIGMKADVKAVAWDGIIPGLNAGRYDAIISSMNINDERKAQVEFVEYMQMAQIFVVRPGVTVNAEADLAGKVIAVQVDTTSYKYVTEDLKARKVAIKEFKGYRDATETFTAVKVGHAEVVVTDEPVGRYYAKKDPKSFAVGGRAIAPEPVGIALKKGNTKLQADLQRAVEEMKKDGTYKRICEKWFGAELGR